MFVRSVPIVIAVVILFVCASLAGCLRDEGRVDYREVEFNELDYFSTRVNGTLLWNIELTVTNATFEGLAIPKWSDVSIAVKSPDGTESTGKMLAQPFPAFFPEDPGAYYVSRGPVYFPEDVDYINLGDSIYIIGLDERFIGGTVKIVWKDETVSTVDLPGDFTPIADITFKEPVMSVAAFPSTITWTSELLVDIVGPDSTRLLWNTLHLSIHDPEGNVLVEPSPLLEDPGNNGYDDDLDGTVDVEFWFAEKEVDDWPRSPFTMDEEDGLKITGLNMDFEGDIIVLYKGEDPIWSSAPLLPFPDAYVEIVLGPSIIESNLHNGSLQWVATIQVMDVIPTGDPITWDSLVVEALGPNDILLFNDSVEGFEEGSNTTELGRWYTEEGIGDGIVSPVDSLVITGLDRSFQGARIGLYRNGILSGFANFPQSFGPEVEIVLAEIDYHEVGPGIVFDVWFDITSVTPSNLEIGWDELEIGVINRTTQKELRPPSIADGEYEWHDVENLNVYYDDYGTVGDMVVAGTQILFCGIPTSYENATVELYFEDELVGQIIIPHLDILEFIYMQLASPNVVAFQIDPDGIPANGDEFYVYDVVISVNKIVPKPARVYWEYLLIKVIQDTGSVLHHPTNMTLDNGTYDRDGSDGIDPEYWYVDIRLGDLKCSPGDAIKITGLSDSYAGATVEFYLHGKLIGSVTLPTEFP